MKPESIAYKNPCNQGGVIMSHSPIYCASYIQYIHGACHFMTYKSTPTVHSYFTTVTQPSRPTFYAFTTGTIADGKIVVRSEVTPSQRPDLAPDIFEYTIPIIQFVYYEVTKQLATATHGSTMTFPLPDSTSYYTDQRHRGYEEQPGSR